MQLSHSLGMGFELVALQVCLGDFLANRPQRVIRIIPGGKISLLPEILVAVINDWCLGGHITTSNCTRIVITNSKKINGVKKRLNGGCNGVGCLLCQFTF